jgi:hypothetical protein
MMDLQKLLAVRCLFLAALAYPVSAYSASAPVLLYIENPPSKVMVKESYAFYVNVKNVSGESLPISVHFSVRDGNIDLDDVGVAKEDGVEITRIPTIPRQRTDLDTVITAVCGWGDLQPSGVAQCAFYVSAIGATLDKIPFVVTIRNTKLNTTLASYVLKYRVYPGKFITNYLRYWDNKLREPCLHIGGKDVGWTPEYGNCYSNQKMKSPLSFPIQKKVFYSK